MDTVALLQFLAFDMLLVLTPGADWAYAIRAGLRRERIAAAVSGLAGGYLVHGALVAVGVGALLARDPDTLVTLTLIGAVYLVGLGVTALRAPGASATHGVEQPATRPANVALRGALVSGLNPKGLLLFFALLPQFVRPEAPWPVSVQLALLGCLHVLACALVYALVAISARALLESRQPAARAVEVTSGALMTGIGVGLAVEQATRL